MSMFDGQEGKKEGGEEMVVWSSSFGNGVSRKEIERERKVTFFPLL
jgi:hypothetical protein